MIKEASQRGAPMERERPDDEDAEVPMEVDAASPHPPQEYPRVDVPRLSNPTAIQARAVPAPDPPVQQIDRM